jgi:predicted nucleic acid-binding protein
MVNLVVDSSVVIKWFVVEPFSAQARHILNDYQTGSVSFIAPDLIYAEVANIVWKKQFFQGLAAHDARDIMTEFRKISFGLTTVEVLLEDAFQLAVRYERSVYESLYLTLSLREQCRLVTADEKTMRAIGSFFPNVIWLPSWQ